LTMGFAVSGLTGLTNSVSLTENTEAVNGADADP